MSIGSITPQPPKKIFPLASESGLQKGMGPPGKFALGALKSFFFSFFFFKSHP